MKGNPAWPGGSLTSRPTWSNTPGCSATSAFFSWLLLHRMVVISGRYRMETSFFTRGISLIAVANAFGMEIPNGTSSAERWANAPGTERELQETDRIPRHDASALSWETVIPVATPWPIMT
jgi:hypothetical protein